MLVGLAVALVACVVAGFTTSAFAPLATGLGDPGAVVRFGLPLVRVVHDLAFATVFGLLMLGVMVVPDDRAGHRRIAVARLASGFALLWAACAGLGLLLSFADVVGAPIGSPQFTGNLGYLWSLDAFKALVVVFVLALAVTVGAALGRSRYTLAWVLALAATAIFPLGLAGHANVAAAHDSAVTGLQLHWVATAIWAGGLIALVVLRPVLGRGLAVVVRRYSTIAAWGLALMVFSGVLNAWLRLGSVTELGSAYGRLVVVKVLAVVALGLLGLRQRRRHVGRIERDPGSVSAFVRLAVTEVAVMGLAAGVAVALSRSAPPVPQDAVAATPVESITGYPAPPAPGPLAWLLTWRVDWLWLVLSLLAVGLYLWGVHRLKDRHDRWPMVRTLSWLAGHAVFLYATQGYPAVYGKVMFSAHMIMHMLIGMTVPIFLVLGAPSTLALRVLKARTDGSFGWRELLLACLHSRWLQFWANPIVAAINFFASLILFYYSGLFELALRTHTGHVLMVVHFLLAGYGFAWVLCGIDPGPRKWPGVMRLIILVATLGFHAWFGIALMSGEDLLAASFFPEMSLPYVPDPLADQKLGGGITWGIAELPTLALALLVTASWMREDTAEARRKDRAADRDDDAELRAYNERLNRLAQHDHRSTTRKDLP